MTPSTADAAAGPHGLLVVDKPTGWTSHDVVARVRRLAGTRRVGHAGTLDPMATGVLVVGLGRATRLLGHLALTTKGYDATIRLGQCTVTDDADGDVVAEGDASGLSDDDVRAAVEKLTGVLSQVPSAVSAVKIDGQRAYRRVRAGEDVALPARTVTVTEFSVTQLRRDGARLDADVHVECSTGTYVRALARDLGETLGVGGHLTRLRRTRVGPYRLGDAVTLDGLQRDGCDVALLPIDAVARQCFPVYAVPAASVPAVRSGRALTTGLGAAGPVAVFAPDGEFLALYEQHGPVARAVAVFAAS